MAATLPLSVCAPVKPECEMTRTWQSRSARIRTFFQIAHEAEHVLAIRTQIDDRICDDLAGPVIGNFSTAIWSQTHSEAFLKNCIWSDNPVIRRTAPARQSVRMLQQQQSVGLGPSKLRALSVFERRVPPRIQPGPTVRLEELFA
jgi:hypothetical protein